MTQVLKSQIMLKFLDMNEFAGNKGKATREKVQVVVIAEGDLLLLEFNTNERRNYHGFQNITGGVDPGETFIVAAHRELREETGVDAKVIELDMEYKYLDRWDHYVTEKVFLCVLNKKPEVLISEEHKSFKWVPIQKVHASDFLFSSNYEAFEKALEHMGKKS